MSNKKSNKISYKIFIKCFKNILIVTKVDLISLVLLNLMINVLINNLITGFIEINYFK